MCEMEQQGGKKRLECYGLLNIYRFSFGVRLASLCKCVKMLLTSQTVCVLYGSCARYVCFRNIIGFAFHFTVNNKTERTFISLYHTNIISWNVKYVRKSFLRRVYCSSFVPVNRRRRFDTKSQNESKFYFQSTMAAFVVLSVWQERKTPKK